MWYLCHYGDIIYVGVSLLTVYEVSTLELWSFQSYTALYAGREVYFYYIAIIFLLVIIIQQSIFLVVIIESFADVRNDSNLIIRGKPQPRPDFVSDARTIHCVCMSCVRMCVYGRVRVVQEFMSRQMCCLWQLISPCVCPLL